MGQQNLSFVEKHVEKVALGVGGVLALASMVLMVGWATGQAEFKPGELTQKVNQIKGDINQRVDALPAVVWKPATERLDTVAAVSPPPVFDASDVVGRVPPAAYGRLPKPSGDVDTDPTKKPRTGPMLARRDLKPLPSPSKPSVVLARGTGGRPVAVPGGTAGAWDKNLEEFTAGVHLQFQFDQEGVLDGWWRIYDVCVAKQEDIRRAFARTQLDQKAAALEFFRKWNVIVLGTEVQVQRFIPGSGWEKDWQDIQTPYTVFSDDRFLTEVRATKIAPRTDKRDVAEVKDKIRKLNELYSKYRGEIEWPTPPGPPPSLQAGAARINIFDPRGLPKAGRGWWPQRPALEIVNPDIPKVAVPAGKAAEKPAVVVAGGPFGEEEPEEKKKKDDKAAKKEKEEPVVAGEGLLTREKTVGQKLGTLGGAARHLCALVLGGRWGNELLPGEVYRFRVRYVLMNPAIAWDRAEPDLENVVYFESPWSEPCEPVIVPEFHQHFIVGAETAAGQRRPLIQMWRWFEGVWYNTRNMPFEPGATLRANRPIDLKGKDRNIPIAKVGDEPALALFDSGAAVVEIQEVPQAMVLVRKPNVGAQPFRNVNAPTIRVTYQDSRGRLFHKYQIYDKDDVTRWRSTGILGD